MKGGVDKVADMLTAQSDVFSCKDAHWNLAWSDHFVWKIYENNLHSIGPFHERASAAFWYVTFDDLRRCRVLKSISVPPATERVMSSIEFLASTWISGILVRWSDL